MMIRILCTIMLVFSVGCSSSDDGALGSVAKPIPDENPGDDVVDSVKWGELDCQKTTSGCDNLVFNLSVSQWEEVLMGVDGLTTPFPGTLSFRCGAKLLTVLKEKTKLADNLTNTSRLHIMEFVDSVFDVKNCSLKTGLKENMNSYISSKK